jgi:hypothetical protein
MKKRLNVLFVVVIMATTMFGCGGEEYQSVTLEHLGFGYGRQKVRISGISLQNWLDENFYNGHGQKCNRLRLTIHNNQTNDDGHLEYLLNAEVQTIGKNELFKKVHSLIKEERKQNPQIEIYGEYWIYPPTDNESYASDGMNLHKVKIAGKLFDLR